MKKIIISLLALSTLNVYAVNFSCDFEDDSILSQIEIELSDDTEEIEYTDVYLYSWHEFDDEFSEISTLFIIDTTLTKENKNRIQISATVSDDSSLIPPIANTITVYIEKDEDGYVFYTDGELVFGNDQEVYKLVDCNAYL